mmetsp:Transcript_43719/g.108195  ORF Transcript_43719/g.108195 Transcript_43719/m.108195 type:complete len:329 (-) Transcript_43719:460-1446(-)
MPIPRAALIASRSVCSSTASESSAAAWRSTPNSARSEACSSDSSSCGLFAKGARDCFAPTGAPAALAVACRLPGAGGLGRGWRASRRVTPARMKCRCAAEGRQLLDLTHDFSHVIRLRTSTRCTGLVPVPARSTCITIASHHTSSCTTSTTSDSTGTQSAGASAFFWRSREGGTVSCSGIPSGEMKSEYSTTQCALAPSCSASSCSTSPCSAPLFCSPCSAPFLGGGLPLCCFLRTALHHEKRKPGSTLRTSANKPTPGRNSGSTCLAMRASNAASSSSDLRCDASAHTHTGSAASSSLSPTGSASLEGGSTSAAASVSGEGSFAETR